MCSFDLQKRIDEFKARVDLFYRDSLSKELLKKFEEHFKNVLLSETKPEDELLARAARIQFVGFLVEHTDNKASTGKTYRLLLSKEDRAFTRASMFKLSGCYEWNNILTYGKCVPDNVEITKINKNDFCDFNKSLFLAAEKKQPWVIICLLCPLSRLWPRYLMILCLKLPLLACNWRINILLTTTIRLWVCMVSELFFIEV